MAIDLLGLNVQPLYNSPKPNIVVVGGSYVGSKVADDLQSYVHETHNIVLVEKSSHFQHIFAFPRLHAVPGFEHKAFIPYTSEYFRAGRESIPDARICAEVVHGLVSSIQPDKVIFESGETIPYEYLVLATGTGQRKTLGPTTVETVEKLQHAEAAEEKTDKEKGIAVARAWQTDVKRAKSIVVVGGGAYGVQLVTDLKTYEPTHSKSVTLVHSRPTLLHNFHHRLHEIAMDKMNEIGVKTVLGQRVVKIEKAETVLDTSNGLLVNDSKEEEGGEYIVHLSGGGTLRAHLVITCLGGTPISEPLQSLAPSAIDPHTGFIRVLPTLQIDTSTAESSSSSSSSSSNSSSTLSPESSKYPNVFALGDVAHTGAHKAARPGHFQAAVVVQNIHTLIQRKAAEKLNGNEGSDVDVVEITEGLAKLSNNTAGVLEEYVPPDRAGIHLRLGMRDSLIFRNPGPGSDTPEVKWDERDSATPDCSCDMQWKKRAFTLWKNGNFWA